MSTRKFLASALAAILLSAPFAVTADAATRTTARHAVSRHHAIKPVRSTTRAPRASASTDHSADSLNTQSLARSRGQQQ